MRRKVVLSLIGLTLMTGLAACGKEPVTENAAVPEVTESVEATTEAVTAEPEEKEEEFSATTLSTEEEIMAFIGGDWRLYDTGKNQEFASISFAPDGSFKFERDFDKTTCEGKLSFEKMYAGESDAPDYYLLSATGESRGIFYICSAGDTDYLELEETGNGDSFVMAEIFRNGPYEGPSYENINRGCVLVRQRDKSVKAETKKNESFTAYAWKRNDDRNIWLQPMISHQRLDYNEFTERRFIGAYFSPETLEASPYELAEDLDTSLLFRDKRFAGEHPLMMYNFLADESGKIIAMSEVDREIYGAYDLGEGNVEFSINDGAAGDGLMFSYNGIDMDLTDLGPANALLDCTKVGEKIVIEGHINPHNSAYYVFDTNTCEFEAQCYGANFIYYEGDITTAVYSIWNEVYNYAGDLIGRFDEGEIYDLEFTDNNKAVKAVCTNFVDGEEFTEEKTFEIPDTGTRSMYYYADFAVGERYSAWARFIKDAPKNAKGFVFIRPREFMKYGLYNSEILDEETEDNLVFVALYDDTEISVESEGNIISETTLRKGEAIKYQVNIPEGIPVKNLIIKVNNEETEFPIGQLSGKDPVHCKFIE